MDKFLFEKTMTPNPQQVAELLGPASSLWEELIGCVNDQAPPIVEEWTWSGKNTGWAMRLKQKKRNLLYMMPQSGSILVIFAIGGKAVERTLASEPPVWLRKLLEDARSYPEGFALRLEVKQSHDLKPVMSLLEMKLSY